MLLRVGYELCFSLGRPTPMILTLNVHSSRAADLLRPEQIEISPHVATRSYRDGFGNCCIRLVAPQGVLRVASDTLLRDSGVPELVARWAQQHPVDELPEETLLFLLGSRYCETDRLSETAWGLFQDTPGGWPRVQAICDFVHRHITFGYEHASSTKTAWEVFQNPGGVCRDFAHLAIAFCRCMNIPARYCTGYLGDIRIPPSHAPMDFAGWMEAYIGGQWHSFDPRNNTPRIGRVLIARGRDAADAAISTTFGSHSLERFMVRAEEVPEAGQWTFASAQ